MSDSVSATLELDACQLVCPMPLLKTRQAMRQVPAGGVLHVTATDRGALRDIPAWVGQAGHTLVHHNEENGVLHFWIRCEEH